MPRVLVVDDHPLWRRTVSKVLERSGLHVVGEAVDVAGAVAQGAALAPDVVLMDLNLPDGHGADATRRLLAVHPEVRVLVLSSSDEREDVLAAVEAGAAGYLLKTVDSPELVDAVRRAAAGEVVVPEDLLRRPQAALPLTPRQLEVLRTLADGRTVDAAARVLGVAPRTLSKHLENAYAALGVAGRIEALAALRAAGLLR